MDDAFECLSLGNTNSSTFSGLNRIDTLVYPTFALRESLVNSVSHCDYSLSSSLNIKVFSDRMELISPGGLCVGVCLSDIRTGFAVRRNLNLSELFNKLRFFKGYGSGIP